MSLVFPKKLTTERVLAAIDFGTRRLASGVSLLSVTSTLVVVHGYDPNPSAMLDGAPFLLGNAAAQWLIGGVPGVTYELTFLCPASDFTQPACSAAVNVLSPPT